MRRTRTAIASGAICALLAFAGCGDDDERPGDVTIQDGRTATTGTETTGTETTGTTGEAVETVNVSLTEFELDPANPRIGEAGVVEFRATNDGQVVHALEVEGPTGEVETEEIQPGESATLKADLSRPGSYTWYCPVGNHEEQGMKGRIRVAGGGSGGTESGTTEDKPKTTEDSGGVGY